MASSKDMCCVGIGDRIENAKSTILGPELNSNFHSSELEFFKKCGARFVCSNKYVPQKIAIWLIGVEQHVKFYIRVC